MNAEERYRSILAKQLARNETVWPYFQDLRISDKTPLRLDFYYFASSEDRAQQLVSFLRGETDYEEVELRSDFSTEAQWLVVGHTHEITVSKEILDQWVERMAAAGFANDCVFDGWSASVEER